MTNNQKVLNLLGVSKKARKILAGYDIVASALSDVNKVFLVFVANDASDKTKEKFINKCEYYQIKLILSFNCDELSKAVGKENSKVIAVCDKGLAESFEKLLKEGVNNES